MLVSNFCKIIPRNFHLQDQVQKKKERQIDKICIRIISEKNYSYNNIVKLFIVSNGVEFNFRKYKNADNIIKFHEF